MPNSFRSIDFRVTGRVTIVTQQVGVFGMNFPVAFLQPAAAGSGDSGRGDMQGRDLFTVTVAATCGLVAFGACCMISVLKARFPTLWALE